MAATAGNFAQAVALALLLSLIFAVSAHAKALGNMAFDATGLSATGNAARAHGAKVWFSQLVGKLKLQILHCQCAQFTGSWLLPTELTGAEGNTNHAVARFTLIDSQIAVLGIASKSLSPSNLVNAPNEKAAPGRAATDDSLHGRAPYGCGASQAFPVVPESLVLDVEMARRIAFVCTEAASELSSLDHWFKNAAAAVKDLPAAGVVDADKTLVPAMDELENPLLSLRLQILRLRIHLPAPGGEHAALLGNNLLLAMQIDADLLESVRAFMWAVLEHDHQANLLAELAAHSLLIVEDLMARLKR